MYITNSVQVFDILPRPARSDHDVDIKEVPYHQAWPVHSISLIQLGKRSLGFPVNREELVL